MDKREHRRGNARRVATLGILVAVAFVLSYIEAILPFSLGIPGIKLGFSHIVTVFALYRMRTWETVLVTLVRVVLAAMLFGSALSAIYSLVGATVSLAVMLVLRRLPVFSEVGVSAAGGVAHNVGQIACAAILMETAGLIWYLPVLLAAGCVSGVVIGSVASLIIRRVRI